MVNIEFVLLQELARELVDEIDLDRAIARWSYGAKGEGGVG